VTSPAPSPRRLFRAVGLICGLTAGALLIPGRAPAQEAPRIGEPIVEVIDALRDQDIRIIYSEELVPARLRVAAVPVATDAFEQLREILMPHGLDVEVGPRDPWLIVQREPVVTAAPAANPTPASPPLTSPSIETIVVTASRYAIERPSAVSSRSITRHTLETSPALGQDPLRITHSLPGVTSNELTSRAHVRGGELDEVLFEIDGVQLFSPYHLKDFETPFSSLNPRLVDSMEVLTGGFDARFGDRLSGVVSIRSIDPDQPRHHELSVDILDTGFLSSGIFGNGRGAWVTSLRRSNLDVLAEETDSDFARPRYSDFFQKVRFTPAARTVVTAGAMTLDDQLRLEDGDTARATAHYDDLYLWTTIAHSGDSGFESRYQLSFAETKRFRNGVIDDPDRATGSLDEASHFDDRSLRADFSYPFSDSLHIRFGVELETQRYRNQFRSSLADRLTIVADGLSGPNSPPPFVNADFEQTRRNAFLSVRWRPAPRVVMDLGGRWDEQSLPDGSQLNPRLNARLDLTERTSLRAAWGRFSQSHSLDEISVADGQLEVLPAEDAEHTIVGIEHAPGPSTLVRIEAYSKRMQDLRPRFENIFERIGLIPELLPDRFRISPISASVVGIEVSAEGRSGAFSWWGNLARARTRESHAAGTFLRSWDEEWSLKLGGEWDRDQWTVTSSTTLRSGWPISGPMIVNGVLTSTAYNQLRLADFTTFDIRTNHRAPTANGEFNWYIEITNLFDRANYCCLDYTFEPAAGGAPAGVEVSRDELLGIVPNIGMRWEF